jgi:hypothetical protein
MQFDISVEHKSFQNFSRPYHTHSAKLRFKCPLKVYEAIEPTE